MRVMGERLRMKAVHVAHDLWYRLLRTSEDLSLCESYTGHESRYAHSGLASTRASLSSPPLLVAKKPASPTEGWA